MTTVFIVADVRISRHGFRALLQGSEGIRVLGTSSSEDAPAHVAAMSPDVVLLDVTTAGHPGVVNGILGSSPRTRVIVMGVKDDENTILGWLEQGACGYLTQPATELDILPAIDDATRGNLHCPPKVAGKLLERVRELAFSNNGLGTVASLTLREKEVAHLLARGLSNKEIAITLSIELSTVKNHVHSILQKAHVHRRAKAATHFE